jgi:hypothetical protein
VLVHGPSIPFLHLLLFKQDFNVHHRGLHFPAQLLQAALTTLPHSSTSP